jgi:5-hydroxyisourate hydrolase
MGRLTTHVLDVAAGVPAQGMRVELHRGSPSIRIASATTDGDGRCPKALLEGDALQRGEYELSFYAGDYFRARAVPLPDPPFLDVVVIRFGIADAAAHYHVPLLVSPWSYSTYRGS